MYMSTVLPLAHRYGKTNVDCESNVVPAPLPVAGRGSASQAAPHIAGACRRVGGLGAHLRSTILLVLQTPKPLRTSSHVLEPDKINRDVHCLCQSKHLQ